MVDENEVYCFEFVNDSAEHIFALWTRTKNSKTDNGTTLHYSFDIGYQPEYAYSVLPKNKSYTGEKVEHEIQNNSIELTLTETPQFLVVAENKTSSIKNITPAIHYRIYPNPAKNNIHISLLNPQTQKIKIAVYSVVGKLEKIVVDGCVRQGPHSFNVGETLTRGIYFVKLQGETFNFTEKIIIQ